MSETASRPDWLIRQENGVLSEARTRAFLLDRFWILDRSVDIEGADFVIQRRLTMRSLLDRTPPRLGFLQAKYFESASTTQYLHRDYAIDKLDRPRQEFFLICHTGREDATRAFFLSASDIVEAFSLTGNSHSRPNRFEILDRRQVLSRMEQALVNAEFVSNRTFMSWALPSIESGEPGIDPDYLEPIPNWWGDIPSSFASMQKDAISGLWRVEEACDLLRGIAETTDPKAALSKAEELYYEFRDSVPLPDRLFDEDFLRVVEEHRTRVGQLREAGLIGANGSLARQLTARVMADVPPKMPLGRDDVYVLRVIVDIDSFELKELDGRFELAEALTLPTSK